MTETPREEILTEAADLITGDRNKSYGSPTENFANTAALWNVQIGHKLKAPLTPADVAQLMTQLKMARMIATPKRDNYADAIGYLACGWECETSAGPAPLPPARYWRDRDGWYWREGNPVTYVPRKGAEREPSDKTTTEQFLRDFAHWQPEEIPFAEVPEWAR